MLYGMGELMGEQEGYRRVADLSVQRPQNPVAIPGDRVRVLAVLGIVPAGMLSAAALSWLEYQ